MQNKRELKKVIIDLLIIGRLLYEEDEEAEEIAIGTLADAREVVVEALAWEVFAKLKEHGPLTHREITHKSNKFKNCPQDIRRAALAWLSHGGHIDAKQLKPEGRGRPSLKYIAREKRRVRPDELA